MGETLRTLVRRLADEPTTANQDAFYQALVAAQVAVPLRTVPAGIGPGQATANGQFAVPSTSLPDGSVMLAVYTDQEAALESPQAQAGFELAGRVVLEMAAANQVGVIVATGCGAAASWAGVAREHVAALLALPERRPAEPGAAADGPRL